MSTEKHRDTVRRLVDILDSGDLSRLDEVCHEDMTYRMNAADAYPGLDAFRQGIDTTHEVFPDLRVSLDELIVDGDRAHMTYTLAGTHEGEYMGIPPSGQRVEHRASALLVFEDGKVAEQTDYFDWLHFLDQLGAVAGDVRPGRPDWPTGGTTLRPQ